MEVPLHAFASKMIESPHPSLNWGAVAMAVALSV